MNHKHNFQFSHQTKEPIDDINLDVYYVICPECGELRKQVIKEVK